METVCSVRPLPRARFVTAVRRLSSPAGGRSHSAESSFAKGAVAWLPASPLLVGSTPCVAAPGPPGTGWHCLRPAFLDVGGTGLSLTSRAAQGRGALWASGSFQGVLLLCRHPLLPEALELPELRG